MRRRRLTVPGRTLAALVAVGVACVLVLAPAAAASGVPLLDRTPVGATALYPGGAASPSELVLNGQPVSVASRQLVGLRAGEEVDVGTEIEVSDDVIVQDGNGGYRWLDAGVTSRIVLTTSPGATSGQDIAPLAGGTVAWRVHHADVVRDASFVVPPDLAGRTMYVNVVLQSSVPGSPPARCFDLDRSTGRFSAAPTCRVHVESPAGLVDLSVLRTPVPQGSGGWSASAIPGTPAGDSELPIPSDSRWPSYGQQQVIWSSAPLTDVRTGDILDVGAQVRASMRAMLPFVAPHDATATGCNVMLAGRFFLSPYPDRLPAPGDPAGSALPALDGGHAFNLTEAQPDAVAGWHAMWTSDGQYTNSITPRRYIVLAAWASGSSVCPLPPLSGTSSKPGLRIDGSGTSGSAVLVRPQAQTAWGEASSAASGNGAAWLGGDRSPRVLAVVPVRVRHGEILGVSGEAPLDPQVTGDIGSSLVVGTSYSGPDDVSGTPIAAPADAAVTPGSASGGVSPRGTYVADGSLPDGQLVYVKLVAWSDVPVGTLQPASTRMVVRVMSPSGVPLAGDLPAPPPQVTALAMVARSAAPAPAAAVADAAAAAAPRRLGGAPVASRPRHDRPAVKRPRGRKAARRAVRARGARHRRRSVRHGRRAARHRPVRRRARHAARHPRRAPRRR